MGTRTGKEVAAEFPTLLKSSRVTPDRYKPRIWIVLLFPGGTVVKNLPVNVGDARDLSLIPGSGRYLEEEMATQL